MAVDADLRHTVKRLGQMLGDTIADAHGPDELAAIEEVRAWGKAAREGDESARKAMADRFAAMSDDELLVMARAFAQFLNLANIAEQRHTVSPAGLAEQEHPNPMADLSERVSKAGISQADRQAAVDRLNIELVLTAHPTEVTRRTLIHKYGELAQQLDVLDDAPTSHRVQRSEQRMRELISQAWHTEEIRSVRPTPVDEARWGLAVIENSLWDAVPIFLRELETELADQGLQLPLEARPLTFSSWMGGDRDGNPNVTATVTERTLLLARWKACELFAADLHRLGSELSMSACTEELRVMAGDGKEPYRELLKSVRNRLSQVQSAIDQRLYGDTTISVSDCLIGDDALLTPLLACYRSLNECGLSVIANGALKDTIRRAHTFGASLLRLDIRQHSERHRDAMAELTRYLGLGDYAEWAESDKQAFLLRELGNRRPLLPRNWEPSPDTLEVIDTCRVISQFHPESLGAYVISMAAQPSDILVTQLLLREAGVNWAMPIAPLFETLDDLNGSIDTMRALFDIEWYRGYCQGRQTVMIGYSDSAKDAGVLAASWAQYRAQEALVELADQYQIELTLFHGRGGSIGRGGGPAHAAILSQPPGSVRAGLRVTEQGEMIRFKFGLPDLAVRSLHLYASAVLEAELLPPPRPKEHWRALMDELADESCRLYRSVVRDHPDFVPYFRAATPEQELGKLPLGSRPSKRKKDGGVESLRAIPWIFAWSQNRLLLPSWLGAVASIQAGKDNNKGDLLDEMNAEWPFFKTRLAMLEMVFMKTDPELSLAYNERLVPNELRELGETLVGYLRSDAQALKSLLSEEQLMRSDHWNRDSILLREPYIEPLHWLQIELLARERQLEERAEDAPIATVEKALMITIAGIAAGMRNTG